MDTKIRNYMLLGGSLLLGTTSAFSQAPAAAAAAVSTTTAAAVGQTITINSTAFVVSAKKQLATGVEFYTAKATTPNAKPVNYLRSNDVYYNTAFAQAQYEAFLSSGKLSSFGTLQSFTVDGTKVNYIIKGSVVAAFAVNGNELSINEVPDDGTIMAKVAGGTPGGTTSGTTTVSDKARAFIICLNGCSNQASNCRANKPPGVNCKSQFDSCLAGCRSAAGMPAAAKAGQSTSHHVLVNTKPILMK